VKFSVRRRILPPGQWSNRRWCRRGPRALDAPIWSSAARAVLTEHRGPPYPWPQSPTICGAPTTGASSCSPTSAVAIRWPSQTSPARQFGWRRRSQAGGGHVRSLFV